MYAVRWLYFVLLVVCAAHPPTTLAQEPPPALIVRLRDASGAGIPSAIVTVVDGSGAQVLGRATTTGEGIATFPPLPAAEVRVLVSGQLPNGVALTQPGDDADGMRLVLGAPALTLEMRSEDDGVVLPDPATSITLETGVAPDESLVPLDPATLPTAPYAVPLPTRPSDTQVPASTVVPIVPTAPAAPTPAPTGVNWPGLLLLGVLLLAVLGVILLQLRWRRLP
jgi:hypothetical protein